MNWTAGENESRFEGFGKSCIYEHVLTSHIRKQLKEITLRENIEFSNHATPEEKLDLPEHIYKREDILHSR